MATSYIDYNDKGFWIRDVDFEFVLYFILKELEKLNINEKWFEEFKEQVNINRLGYFIGMMNIFLDDYLNTEEKKRIFIDVIDNVIEYMRKKKIVTKDECNEIEAEKAEDSRRICYEDVNLEGYVKILLKIKNLFKD